MTGDQAYAIVYAYVQRIVRREREAREEEEQSRTEKRVDPVGVAARRGPMTKGNVNAL